jgi:hypothetical protein
MDTEAWLRTEETTVPTEGDTSEATEQTIRTCNKKIEDTFYYLRYLGLIIWRFSRDIVSRC